MLVLLGFSLFCIVTTLGMPDHALIASEATVQLPFADVPISFLGFVITAPFVLIVLTIYLHVLEGYRLELDGALKEADSKSQKLPALFNLQPQKAKRDNNRDRADQQAPWETGQSLPGDGCKHQGDKPLEYEAC